MGFGDELMVSGHCRVLQEKDPRKVRLVYGKRLWSPVWDGNPRIAGLDEVGDFQTYEPRPRGLRPYIKSKGARRWEWLPYRPPVGEIYFTDAERRFADEHAGLVVIDPTIKGAASPNKQWPTTSWKGLVDHLSAYGLVPTQIGKGQAIRGARVLETPTFRHAAAVLSTARIAILHEGGLHHAAAAVGKPAVVIYGGYISPEQTGYELHSNLFSGGEPCGMRIRCAHCDDAMARITPERVFQAVLRLLAR